MASRSLKESKAADFTKLAPMVTGEDAKPVDLVPQDQPQPIKDVVQERQRDLRSNG